MRLEVLGSGGGTTPGPGRACPVRAQARAKGVPSHGVELPHDGPVLEV